MRKLLLALLVASSFAQSPSGQGSTGGQGSISQQPGTVVPLVIQTPDPLPGATQNVSYLAILQATGGIPCTVAFPYNWTVISGSLPPGMILGGISGSIEHFTTSLGTFTFGIEVSDCSGRFYDKTFHITVTAASIPVITTPSPLPGFIAGTNGTDQLAAQGGTGAITWSKTAGSLPPGCTFPSGAGSDSLVCSPPTTSGTYNFTAVATDSLLNPSAPVNFAVTVTCPSVSISSSGTWPDATKGQSYSLGLTYSGGVAPITWGLSGQPTGLTINTSTGLVSGTPSVNGSFLPIPTVTDSCLATPSTANQNATLTVNNNTGPLSLSTTTPLSSGTVGTPITLPLTATGGTPPYTYSNPTANLPTSLSISGATITGTPTVAGNYTSITLRVTDSLAATNDGNSPYSMQINSASNDDSRYCNSSGAVVGLTDPGPATQLQNCVYTPLSATPASGPTKTVCSSGCDYATVQAAVNAASCGWIINIKATSDGTPAGTQNVFSGLTTLPATACSSNWIWLETSLINDASFAPEGSRISPAYVGITSLPARPAFTQPPIAGIYMPQLINNAVNQPTLTCTPGITHWRIMGLELATTSGVRVQNAIASCTNAVGVIFDRDLVHGGNNRVTPGRSTDTVSQGIHFDGQPGNAVLNSYIYDIHCVTGDCTDNYPIFGGGCQTTTSGPTKVVNNFLEAAGESFFTGGCGSAASVPATDIEFRRNHLFKPVPWKTTDASYWGTSFDVKNAFELKNANRWLVEGNILDTTWSGQSDQAGQLMNIGSKNQSSFVTGVASSSGSTLTRISGANFNGNATSANCATPNHCKVVFNGVSYQAQTFVDGNHLVLTSSPPATASASFSQYSPGLNPNAIVANGTIRYNILQHASRVLNMYAAPSDGGDVSLGTNSISFHDNTADDIDGWHWTQGAGACCFYSLALSVQNSFVTPNNMHDIWVFNNTLLEFLTGGAGSQPYPGMGFGYQTPNGGVVTNLKIFNNISTAGWGGGGGWASSCGATPTTMLAMMQCYDNLSGTPQHTFCFDGNVLATTTQGTPSASRTNPPYPNALQSPSCPFTPIGNSLAASFAALQFTSLNGANGGNYTLTGGSPYHHGGSDGNDPGANVSLVNQYTQGVN